jgi:hypothetical protein
MLINTSQLLKSLHTLTESLPSTLETLGTQKTVTLAIVFGLGRAKCFIQLSGADFAEDHLEAEQTQSAERPTDEIPPSPRGVLSSDENVDSATPIRRLSSRPPLQEITPSPTPTALDTLTSQLASCSLKPSPSEASMRKAERALAQSMSCSDVEFSGNLSPMGAQVYLKAPRGFRHASWAVRQDAGRTLDGPYEALCSERGSVVECVRVRAKGAVDPTQGEDEEMIWWGWEGRLAGYA